MSLFFQTNSIIDVAKFFDDYSLLKKWMMKKAIIPLLFIIVLFSCQKDDLPVEKFVIINNYNHFTGQKIKTTAVSYNYNSAGFGSVMSSWDKDTFELKETGKLYKSEIFDKAGCVNQVIFNCDNFYPFWSYFFCGYDFNEFDTLHNALKPFVNLQLDIQTDKKLVYLKSRVEVGPSEIDTYRRTNYLLDETIIKCLSKPFSDTLINLQIIQDETIFLKVNYKEEGVSNTTKQEFEIITNMDENYIQAVKI